MVGQGLLQQIQNGSKIYYSDFTVDTLDQYLKELSTAKNRNIIVPVSDFLSRYLTALYKKDEVEFAKLELESLLATIERYKNISRNIGVDYDLVYMLSSYFSLQNVFNNDVVWEIETIYFHENEYDDSYKCTQLRWHDGKFIIEEFFSDCYYDYKKISEKEITEEDIFKLIIDKNNV
jgi:hypothetical protein